MDAFDILHIFQDFVLLANGTAGVALLLKKKINLLKRLACGFRAHEPDERYGNSTGSKTPDPQFPTNVIQSDSSSKHSDETKKPFSKRASCSPHVAKLERGDLEDH